MIHRSHANVVQLASALIPIALLVFAVLNLEPTTAIAQVPPAEECGYGFDYCGEDTVCLEDEGEELPVPVLPMRTCKTYYFYYPPPTTFEPCTDKTWEECNVYVDR